MKGLIPLTAVIICVGCISGSITRTPAKPPIRSGNSMVLKEGRETVWARGIPILGKTFFVINNLDKQSGLVNISYSGDPEKYVDGGEITSTVSGPGGTSSISFPASTGQKRYPGTWPMANGMKVVSTIQRTLALDGRANIILEEISATETRVTVNIRYILTKDVIVYVGNESRPFHGVLTMNSGGRATFPGEPDTYYPTGALEEEILNAFK